MLKRTPAGDPEWYLGELLLKSSNQTPTEQGDLLKALEAKVVDSKAPYACILVDDLLADAYPFVAQVYDNLRNVCVVFMVFTSCDAKIAAQIDKSFHNVRRVQVGPLTPDDAMEYIATRYQLFRLPSTNGINTVPLFPFDEPDIRTAVKVKTWSGSATTGPVTLRLVASILEAALSNRLQEIAKKDPKFDVHTLAAEDLRQLLIKVAQSYSSSVVRR